MPITGARDEQSCFTALVVVRDEEVKRAYDMVGQTLLYATTSTAAFVAAVPKAVQWLDRQDMPWFAPVVFHDGSAGGGGGRILGVTKTADAYTAPQISTLLRGTEFTIYTVVVVDYGTADVIVHMEDPGRGFGPPLVPPHVVPGEKLVWTPDAGLYRMYGTHTPPYFLRGPAYVLGRVLHVTPMSTTAICITVSVSPAVFDADVDGFAAMDDMLGLPHPAAGVVRAHAPPVADVVGNLYAAMVNVPDPGAVPAAPVVAGAGGAGGGGGAFAAFLAAPPAAHAWIPAAQVAAAQRQVADAVARADAEEARATGHERRVIALRRQLTHLERRIAAATAALAAAPGAGAGAGAGGGGGGGRGRGRGRGSGSGAAAIAAAVALSAEEARRLQSLRDEITKTSEEIADAELAYDDAKSDLAARMAMIGEVETKLREAAADVAAAKKRYDGEMKDAAAAKKKLIDDHNRKVEQIRRLKEKSDDDLSNKRRLINEENAKAATALTETKKKLEETNAELKAQEEALSEAEKELGKVNDRLKTAEGRMASAVEREEKLKRDIDDVRTRTMEAGETLVAETARLAEIVSDIEAKKKEAEEASRRAVSRGGAAGTTTTAAKTIPGPGRTTRASRGSDARLTPAPRAASPPRPTTPDPMVADDGAASDDGSDDSDPKRSKTDAADDTAPVRVSKPDDDGTDASDNDSGVLEVGPPGSDEDSESAVDDDSAAVVVEVGPDADADADTGAADDSHMEVVIHSRRASPPVTERADAGEGAEADDGVFARVAKGGTEIPYHSPWSSSILLDAPHAAAVGALQATSSSGDSQPPAGDSMV